MDLLESQRDEHFWIEEVQEGSFNSASKSIPGSEDVRQKERQTAVIVQPVNVDVALFGVLVSELSLNH